MWIAANALELPVTRVLQVVRASGEASSLAAKDDVNHPSNYAAAFSALAKIVAIDLGVPTEIASQRCAGFV
jgi:hypothetical protein